MAMLAALVLVASACPEDSEQPGADGGGPVTCLANVSKCLGDTLKTCNAAGSGWQQQDCAASGQRCLAIKGEAQCTSLVCDPFSGGCTADGKSTRSCSADGKQWTAGKACQVSKGELCFAGKCDNACARAAKDRQNVGCTFYPVNLQNEEAAKVGVVVSNPNPLAATVTLSDAKGQLESKSVQPGKLATFFIAAGKNALKGSGLSRLAFKLSATLPVAAYQFSPLNKAEQRSTDASLLLAKAALGKRHFVFSAQVGNLDNTGYVTVVGVEAGTKVTVTPTADTVAGAGVPAIKAGKEYTATLGELDVLQLNAAAVKWADMTGTRVASDKPVAVFGGHTCADMPVGKSYCDHLQEQLPAVESWGWAYVAVKFMPRGQTSEDDSWRVMASEDQTTITFSGGDKVLSEKKLQAGEYHQIDSASNFVVKSDKAIAVAHYTQAQEAVTLPLDLVRYSEGFQTPKGCTTSLSHGNLGDPGMSAAVPVTQWRKNYIFLTPDTYRYDFVTITVKTDEGDPDVLLDGKQLTTKLTPLKGTDYSYARLRVTDGPHTISSDAAFGLEVYGYDCNVSYAYTGGSNLKAINPIQ